MSESTSPSFWRGVGKVLQFLFRFVVVLALGVGIGAGLYYGVPWVYRNVIQPVQHNAFRLDTLEAQTSRMQMDFQESLRLYDNRLTALEAQVAQLQADLAEQSESYRTLDADLRDVQATTAAQSQQIEQLEQAVQEQADALQAQAQTLTELSGSLRQTQEAADATASALEKRVGAVELQTADVPAWLNDLAGQLALQQTGQALLKARVLLLEDNPRAAKASLAEAEDFLARAVTLLPEREDLPDLQKRLAQVPTLIDRRSYRTTAELESLWGEVMDIAAQLAPTAPFSAGVPLSATTTFTVETAITQTVLLSPLSTPLPPQETP